MAKPDQKTSPVGTFVYPHLRTPDTRFSKPGEPGDLKTTLRLSAKDAGPMLDAIEAAFGAEVEAAEKWLADLPKAKSAKIIEKGGITRADAPFTKVRNDQGEETGEVDFRFKVVSGGMTRERPGKPSRPYTNKVTHFDAKGAPTQIELPMFGARGKVSFLMSTFTNPNGLVIVSMKPTAVQILQLRDSADRDAASYGFGVEEGYASDDPVADNGAPFDTDGTNADLDPLL